MAPRARDRVINARQTVPARKREDWTITTEITVHGRQVRAGHELSVDGVRGRVRFVQYIETNKGDSWVDVRDGAGQTRAFHLDRIRTVHNRRTP